MEFSLTFGGKKYKFIIKVKPEGRYDLELFTKERISGDEFQKLKSYIEAEGYIDMARGKIKV